MRLGSLLDIVFGGFLDNVVGDTYRRGSWVVTCVLLVLLGILWLVTL